jgi:hypothetical protein
MATRDLRLFMYPQEILGNYLWQWEHPFALDWDIFISEEGVGRIELQMAESPGSPIPGPSGDDWEPMSKGHDLLTDPAEGRPSDVASPSTTTCSICHTCPRASSQPTNICNKARIISALQYCIFPGILKEKIKEHVIHRVRKRLYIFIFFLVVQCVESGVSCTDCY